ncbi:MAG: sulfite exporter TauE/SafE family protein [Alphaproteobacteria bacterium]|nr:sulfite exporter TauE/SafE family protein [Alphaproteobacteria bacterium]
MIAVLILSFFVTALLYASVGFGGGSTYNALLVLHGADYRILPAIALICNIIVVSGGAWRFSRTGDLNWRGLAPFLMASVPAAWMGGRIPITETVFIGVLGGSLLIAGAHLLLQRQRSNAEEVKPTPMATALTVGGGIGFLSGLVGIGGGIFLAPILYFLHWGRAKEIAGACSLFILVNSLSGLTGQFMKLQSIDAIGMIQEYWLLFPAVLVGGQIGSRLSTTRLSPKTIKRLTAVLILYVSVRLLLRWLGLVV